MSEPLRAAVYARVSSAGQRDRHTIESQLRDVPAYCAAQGWSIVGTYVDDGRTAKAGHLEARDGYHRLLRDAKAGAFDVVAVVAVDRFTRSEDPVERAQVVASVVATGARIAVVGAGILDPRTFAGDAYLTLQALFAAEENRRRRERTIGGQITAAGRGRKPRGRTPFGLTYRAIDAHCHEWGHHPEHAEIVREVFVRVAGGASSGSIATMLNARRIPRPDGGAWYPSKVQALIASDVYVGRFVTDRRRNLSVPVPPIVSSELATEARAVLLARYRRPPPRSKWHSLLGGVARCGCCGEAIGLTNSTDRRAGTKPPIYRCLSRRYYLQDNARCALPTLRVAETDARVWDAVTDAIDAATIDQVLAFATHKRPAGNVADARAEIVRVDRLQDAVLDQLARGLISQDVADAQIARLGARRQAAQAAARDAEAESRGIRAASDVAAVSEALEAFRRGAAVATGPERTALIRAVVSVAVIRAESIALDLRIAVPTSLPVSAPSADCAGWAGVTVRLGRLRVAPVVTGRLRVALPMRVAA